MKKQVTQTSPIKQQIAFLPLLLMLVLVLPDATSFGPLLTIVVLGAAIVSAWSIAGHVKMHLWLKKRNEKFSKLIAQRGVLPTQSDKQAFQAALGAIDEVEGVRAPRITNMVHGADWTYADFTYDVYQRTKYGEEKSATVFYGVMAAELPRMLPNVFFDSKKARKRQFRFHFAGNQQHSLEGDFDNYFATYFPGDYHIDSLSFITPDVMWELKNAVDYDIEIFGNKLFLYGALTEPDEQIADMQAKITAIKARLMQNITTYRDERIPFASGRERVAADGLKLKRFTLNPRIAMILAIIVFVLIALIDFVSDSL